MRPNPLIPIWMGMVALGVVDKCCDVVVGECRKNEMKKIFVRLRACQ